MSNTDNFKECYVAFLDILGIKNFVSNIRQNKDLLKNLINVLKINSKFEPNKKMTSYGKLEIRSWYFSDSFVFVMKRNGNDQNLSQLFLIIRFLQDRFWEKGFCLRGAITLEKIYYPTKNENILLGNGIIKAYNLENEIAIYPRIIIDERVYKIIEDENLQGYPYGNKNTNLKDLIKKDKDGIYFLDLLNKNILRPVDERIESNSEGFSIRWSNTHKNNLRNIKKKVEEIVERELNNSNNNLKIKQKYEWLKSYLEETKEND